MKILIVYANRAEESILNPIYKELKNRCYTDYINLSNHIDDITLDSNLSKIYEWTYQHLSENEYDKVVVLGDRREIMFACLACFIKQIPLVQLASGDVSTSLATVDDYFRHLITIMTTQQISFSEKSLNTTEKLLESINVVPNVKQFVNPTLSNIDISSLKREIEEPYDLILVHPQSLSQKGTIKDMIKVKNTIIKGKKNIIIRGNEDKNSGILETLWEELGGCYNTVDKNRFLSFLKYCDRFITNSSCSYYEAPLFLEEKQIVRIGSRNKGREIVKYNKEDLNSTERMVEYILNV